MISPIELYLITIALFSVLATLLYFIRAFTIFRMVLVLFAMDIALTIQAAYSADVVLIAVLHIITIPAFFALIYVDLVRNHRNEFRCFLCGEEIEVGEETVSIKRTVSRRFVTANVHAQCLNSSRKAISGIEFKKGIPK